jgi:hypothetical protein
MHEGHDMPVEYLCGSQKFKDHLKYLGIDGRIILFDLGETM